MEKKCELQHHLDVFIEKYIGFELFKWTFNCPFCYSVACFYLNILEMCLKMFELRLYEFGYEKKCLFKKSSKRF